MDKGCGMRWMKVLRLSIPLLLEYCHPWMEPELPVKGDGFLIAVSNRVLVATPSRPVSRCPRGN